MFYYVGVVACGVIYPHACDVTARAPISDQATPPLPHVTRQITPARLNNPSTAFWDMHRAIGHLDRLHFGHLDRSNVSLRLNIRPMSMGTSI